jgi:isopentenyl diphosphate isomerase/L-lactate dehydrogenase-like FMN-dependent dehydrogenase
VTRIGEFIKELQELGALGRPCDLPVRDDALEEAARRAMSASVFGYVAGAAGMERTAHANSEAFSGWVIVPRHMRGVVERDLTTTILETPMSGPVLLAPIGGLGVVHPYGELAVARVARRLGIPMILSTISSTSLEEVAAELRSGDAAQPRLGWFQFYWPQVDEVAYSLIQRAERAGYGALVITIDTGAPAWRPRDLTSGFSPARAGEGLANYLTDPAFRALLEKPPEEDMSAAVTLWSRILSRPGLNWRDIDWLCRNTSLPVLVKGVCHPDDAAAAVGAGVRGIIVSNHGGRQIDGAKPALDCLPDVVARVRGVVPVLFDSGIRSGTDIFKALALGASAVLVGRPYVFGLALRGGDGVEHVLRCLLAELDATMALSGHRSLSSLTVESLGRSAHG